MIDFTTDGNQMKMRYALESVRNWCYNKLHNTSQQVTVEGLLSIVNAALAEPPRNCDVGTAEEQTERFRKFCKMDYISEDCPDDCPLYRKDYSTNHCPFAWAQMPYTQEGGAK